MPVRRGRERLSRGILQSDRESSERGWALRVLTSNQLIYALAGFGVLLRVAQYAANRSLWYDESLLASNLIEKRLPELAGSLDFDQAAPVGFLVTEGAVAKVLGYSESALRAFPLVCGVLSILAFVWLARRILPPAAAPLAVLLFVVADGLVYYSSEVKPYESDVAAALGLLISGVVITERAPRLTPMRTLALALVGLVLIAFSFPAILVVAALALTLVMTLLIERGSNFSPAKLVVMLCWVITSIGVVGFAAVRVRSVRDSFELSSGSFLGITGDSSLLHALNVMGTRLAASVGFPQERPFNHLEKVALVCAIVGALALLRRRPAHFAVLVLPFPLLLGASAFQAYPIVQRTMLFLIPAVLLMIASGIYQFVRWTPAPARVVMALLLTALIVVGPVWAAGKHLVQPRKHEEVRPVLSFIRDHWRVGDTLYVHYGAQHALLYYNECRCLRLTRPHSNRRLWPVRLLQDVSSQHAQAAVSLTPGLVLGRHFDGPSPRPYVRDLNRIEGRDRVWYLYSHLNYDGEQLVVDRMLGRLKSLGVQINGIERTNAHAYLFRLH
jgi:hypothetical protein